MSGSTSSDNHSGEWISSNWVYDIAKLDYLNFSSKKTYLFNSLSILDTCVARNMSCYGSNIIRNNTEMVIMDDQCCESCNDVIKNYQALGWHFDTKHFSQCLGDFLWILRFYIPIYQNATASHFYFIAIINIELRF